jgi:hypothetical protein
MLSRRNISAYMEYVGIHADVFLFDNWWYRLMGTKNICLAKGIAVLISKSPRKSRVVLSLLIPPSHYTISP